MHELPVTESILNIAIDHATKAKATKITKIHIVIGKLSSIVDDSVQFYWDIISKDSIAENAKLQFHRVEAEIECSECHHQYKLENELIPCPECGSINIKFKTGDEFYMESIEIIN
jgi:hydrogenase nickel incorporation protein HypA/HybF